MRRGEGAEIVREPFERENRNCGSKTSSLLLLHNNNTTPAPSFNANGADEE